MSAPGKLMHSCTLPLRWGDMDAYGHLNNVVYIRYLEEARVQLLLGLGAGLQQEEQAPVVINVGCTFLRPLVYPDSVRVECYVSEPGRSSFMIRYRLYGESAPGQLAGEGYSKVVWMDQSSGRSVPLPDAIRSQIEA
ncbi:acyl-CoA thioesterase [Marinobacterium aestuariivivens]|uniref:Acyl-CoA thioesterase n=1 Tax=Marinobacterium aestuariivivens TaxID=1698799 RepID=A0ABW1ZYI9_9GAMM